MLFKHGTKCGKLTSIEDFYFINCRLARDTGNVSVTLDGPRSTVERAREAESDRAQKPDLGQVFAVGCGTLAKPEIHTTRKGQGKHCC